MTDIAQLSISIDTSDLKQADRALDRFTDTAEDAENQTKDLEKSTTKMATAFAAAAAAAVTAGGLFTKAMISAASEAENYRVRLESVLKSSDRANMVFKDMANFAGQVPFEFRAIMESATNLTAVVQGNTEKVNRLIPVIGDIAAATGLSIQQTTEQMIKVISSGITAAETFKDKGITDALQLSDEAKASADKTVAEILRLFESGQASFAGTAERLADTWDGQVSMMADKWFSFRIAVADGGIFESMKGALADFNQFWNDNSEQILETARVIGSVMGTVFDGVVAAVKIAAGVIGDNIDIILGALAGIATFAAGSALVGLISSLGALPSLFIAAAAGAKALTAALLANPIGLIVAGFAAAGAALFAYREEISLALTGTEDWWVGLRALASGVVELFSNLLNNVGTFATAWVDLTASNVQTLKDIYNGFFDFIKSGFSSLGSIISSALTGDIEGVKAAVAQFTANDLELGISEGIERANQIVADAQANLKPLTIDIETKVAEIEISDEMAEKAAAASDALEGLGNTLDEAGGGLSDFALDLQAQSEELDGLIEAYKDGTEAGELYAAMLDAAAQKGEALTQSEKEQIKAIQEKNRVLTSAQLQADLDEQIKQIGELEAALRQGSDAYELMAIKQDLLAQGAANDDSLEQLARQAKEVSDRFEEIDRQVDIWEQIEKEPLQDWLETAQDGFVDLWEQFKRDGFDAFEDIGDFFKDLLKQLGNAAIANLFQPVFQQINGLFSGASVSAAGQSGGFGLGNLFGGLFGGSGPNGARGSIPLLTGQTGVTRANPLGTGFGVYGQGGGLSGILGDLNGGFNGLFGGDSLTSIFEGGFTSGLSTLARGAGLAFAGFSLGQTAAGLFTDRVSQSGSQIGGGLGGAIGFAAGGPVGAGIGSLLGSLGGGVFGDKDYEHVFGRVNVAGGQFGAGRVDSLDGADAAVGRQAAQAIADNANSILNAFDATLSGRVDTISGFGSTERDVGPFIAGTGDLSRGFTFENIQDEAQAMGIATIAALQNALDRGLIEGLPSLAESVINNFNPRASVDALGEALDAVKTFDDIIKNITGDTKSNIEQVVDDLVAARDAVRAVVGADGLGEVDAAFRSAQRELRQTVAGEYREAYLQITDPLLAAFDDLLEAQQQRLADVQAVGQGAQALFRAEQLNQAELEQFIQSTLEAGGSIADLTSDFEKLRRSMESAGESTAGLQRAFDDTVAGLSADFNQSVEQALLQATDPARASLVSLLETFETRTDEANAIIAAGGSVDLDAVQRLNSTELTNFVNNLADQERSRILSLFDEEQSLIATRASTFQGLGQDILNTRDSLVSRFSSASGAENLEDLRGRFDTLVAESRLGNESALRALPQVADSLIDVSRNMFASTQPFQDELARVNDALEEVGAGALDMATEAQLQLDKLDDQISLLTDIKGLLEGSTTAEQYLQSIASGDFETSIAAVINQLAATQLVTNVATNDNSSLVTPSDIYGSAEAQTAVLKPILEDIRDNIRSNGNRLDRIEVELQTRNAQDSLRTGT